MSQNIDLASIRITDQASEARNSMFNKVDWNKLATVSLNIPKQHDTNVIADNISQGVDHFLALRLNPSSWSFDGSFNNTTLEGLRSTYDLPEDSTNGKWMANIIEEHGRIAICNNSALSSIRINQTTTMLLQS